MTFVTHNSPLMFLRQIMYIQKKELLEKFIVDNVVLSNS